ncbi:MMPL family transporter [Paenibacillus silviterrae]|uniref:MMPL family transporter n=1 Tax=Paenibacillus silviterrae TaxID=3242194 RepID=UPI0025439683|nr:efflux RND transporter permease subunit [Paenibacillus chinjuensis]
MITMLAKWSVKYARRIILFWVFFLSAAVPSALQLPHVLNDHGLRIAGSYSELAEKRLASEFHLPREPIILLFRKEASIPEEQLLRAIERAIQFVQPIPGVGELVTPWDQEGMQAENAAYVLVGYHLQGQQLDRLIRELRSRLVQEQGISVALTGKPVVQADVNASSRLDLSRAELVGLPVAFLILWWAFRGLRAAFIPIAAGLVSVAGAMGIMHAIGTEQPLSVFVLNVIPMVGLALSIDFALILVSRFREEQRRQPALQALADTLRTSGKAIVFSALCVLLGLVGVCFFRMTIFTSVAFGAMVVLALSTVVTLTLVPALLAVMADRLQTGDYDRKQDGFWQKLSSYVMQRPVRICMLCIVLLLVCLAPAAELRLAVPDAKSLPPDAESRQAAEAWERLFQPPGSTSLYFISKAKSQPREASILVQELLQDSMVVPHSVVSHTASSGTSLIRLSLLGSTDAPAVMAWLRNAEHSRTNWLIGGEAKYRQEVLDQLISHMDEAALFILVSNVCILLIAFRSVLLPLKMILMNMLSLGAAFGLLAWLFQEGRLGLEETDVAVMIPVFIFGLTFGISMDYGVFLISRMAEAYRRTGSNAKAVQQGLALTGRLITSAAAIMIAVTLPFATAGVSGVKQLGIGIACAVLIDATLIRMLLVPAFMKLMGRWNWWFPGTKI